VLILIVWFCSTDQSWSPTLVPLCDISKWRMSSRIFLWQQDKKTSWISVHQRVISFRTCTLIVSEAVIFYRRHEQFFFFFFFFFYWYYNPLWVLAFSVIFFHSALSLHCCLHRLIPIICISSSISTIPLFLDLPPILVPISFYSNMLLGVLLSSIRITWPSQAILLLFINLTISAFSLSSFSS
jgi:hypothetical protein